MFAIHSKVEMLKRDERRLGTYARHYYDLFQLSQRPEVLDMLQSIEYGEIKHDYDLVSRIHFPGSYFFPDQMSFANSDALFPKGWLFSDIGGEYEGQCEILCFGAYPSWDAVPARFVELRELL
jgi:hypothetical protein